RMLAFANRDSGQVSVFRLPDGKIQELIRDLPGITEMAFSDDARHLAIGSSDGRIRIIDVATHLMAYTLVIGGFAPTPIAQLAAGPEGTWIMAYRNAYL